MYLHLIYAVIVSEEQRLIRTKMVKSLLIIIMYNSHSCNNGSDILVFFQLSASTRRVQPLYTWLDMFVADITKENEKAAAARGCCQKLCKLQ